jgi:hypothetical protein
MNENRDINRRPNPPDHLKGSGSFVSHLLLNPKARVNVMEAVSIASHNQYQAYRPALEATLSATELALYSESQKIPYASKDWYRYLHDLIVTASLEVIANRENEAKRLEPLPRWLVAAALLHDRGYGILAAQGAAVQGSLQCNSKGTAATEYITRGGAHWEQPDTRVLHSRLSRDLAEFLLFPESAEPAFVTFCESKGVESMLNPHEVVGLADKETFLSVITKHDHPLIGRCDELPPVGRHHFDADSLFSISLSSFVKDYLSYCSDTGKMKRAYDLGLCAPGAFTPYVLLEARLARYFPTEESLPVEWDRIAYPLLPNAVAFSESGRCIEPHSDTARELTIASFFALVECCKVLAEIESEQAFLLWFNDALKAQCESLFRRIEAISRP